ncbi:cyclic nucleotide-binding protein [Mucilaginibacter sp. PPCGB 2223]|uniref:Crp/Fnr family transcriptional regulator n=1 Tax=Mucilaginibacter sp. PPCGB 2223 TaxID=1886027 RepID=UPI00082470C4|nr:Crp/Fnr family transcriptional regulator [Mucilaginibacter sp. PPCGB 2223]OCX52001.1 cyclic nucleotide-binding protein [Mucilaginibacter sp. PPCGB 2223]
MNELESYIHHYFSISTADCQTIAGLFNREVLNKGDFYLKTGRYCNKMSFIKQGMLRIYVTLPGNEVTQWISAPGYFVTDLAAFLFRTPARWNIQALTDTELFTIDHEAYTNIGKLIPKWHELEKLFIGKCFVMLENRVFDHLSLSAEERYDRFFDQNRELFNQVPLQYLASMLGMTPETFSRIRRKKLS